jgi:hypothetical protein
VPKGVGAVVQLSAQFGAVCAIQANQNLTCWGNNSEGQTKVPADLNQVSQVSTPGDHTCVLTKEAGVRCWGSNYFNQCTVPLDLNVQIVTTRIIGQSKSGYEMKSVVSPMFPNPSFPKTHLNYQWLLGGIAIKGATASAYKIPRKLKGGLLSVESRVTLPSGLISYSTSRSVKIKP